MLCGECGTENPSGHRFCGECGHALARACPSCGTAVEGSPKFCGECGHALAGASPAPATTPVPTGGVPVSERRVCSVLFADLVGFTPLSESRDPEEVRELLSAYFETARTVIGRYGGLVEKFIGDAVMAVWGTPVATEGDAERAVRAALDLVAEVSALGARVGAEGLALRAGVVTGEVAVTVGAVGQGMVAGDAVNTAARVQSAATPGTVWVDAATQRLSRDTVGFRETGEHPLKGKAEPVPLWEATRVLASIGGTQRIDGLEAPMLGRDYEERTLRELLHTTWERDLPRLVVVTGPAGAGKSRLGWEFEKYVDGLLDPVFWHRGRCLSYGDGVAYWALAEAMRQRFGIAEEDTRDEATDRFLAGLDRLVTDPAVRSYVGVRLGRLLGLAHPDDTGVALDRDELFAGWRLFLERLGDTEPVVLLVEDAEHADEGLLDFLEHVVDWARTSPIYTIVFGRSELIERRPGLGAGRNRTTLTLDPLDEASMRELVSALVRDLPADAAAAIAGQAQGNPLFAVETVRSLIDRDVIVPVGGEYRLVGDVGALTVPDSLHGLLAARLDALDPELRSLVADAAVLGTTFPAEALAAVAGVEPAVAASQITELVRRGVLEISTDPLSPQRGNYGFSQNMLRTVAYETLSRRDRKARHLAVAAHLQSAVGEEMMDVVARHYLDALEASASEDGDRDEIRERAVASLVRAGERSDRAGARKRAAASFTSAADLTEPSAPAQAAALLLRAAEALASQGAGAACVEVARRAGALHDAAGDQRRAAVASTLEAQGLRLQGRTVEAFPVIEAAVDLLREQPDVDTVRAHNELAMVAAFGGRPESLALSHEALGAAQAIDVPLGLVSLVFTTSGIAHTFHRRRLEAIAYYRFALELAERAGDTSVEGRALNNLAAATVNWDPPEGVRIADRAVALSRRSGDSWLLASGLTNRGVALLMLGEWDAVLAVVDDDEPAVASGDAYLLGLRAVVCALRGDLDGAHAALAGSDVAELRDSDDVQDLAEAHWVDATLAAAAGDLATAVDHVRELMEHNDVPDLDFEGVVWAWPLGVWCAFEAGLLADARALVDQIGAQPVGALPPVTRGVLAVAQVRLAALDGETDLEQRWADAVAQVRESGSPYHLAHALLDHAAHLTTLGHDATALVDEATLIGERLGAADVRRRVGATDVIGV